MPQRHPVEKLHCDERHVVLLANVIDRADVGMIQRRRSLGLALKTGARDGVTRDATSSGRNLRATKRCRRVSSAL